MNASRRPFRKLFDILRGDVFVSVYVSLLLSGIAFHGFGRMSGNDQLKRIGWMLMMPFAIWLTAFLALIVLVICRRIVRRDA